jgi:seryl-tRNA synthetase
MKSLTAHLWRAANTRAAWTRPLRAFSDNAAQSSAAGEESAKEQNLRPFLNYKKFAEEAEQIERNIANRKSGGNIQRVVELYKETAELTRRAQALRNERNQIAKKAGSARGNEALSAELSAQGTAIKTQIAQCEERLAAIEEHLIEEGLKIPNDTHSQVPIGDEPKAKQVALIGKKPKFSFEPKDHIELGLSLDLLDFDNARNVSGSKFVFLKNEAALLELALVQWSMHKLASRGFTPILTPDMINPRIARGCGFQPRDAQHRHMYSIEDEALVMAATAEIPLAGYFMNQTFAAQALPKRMAGFSHCFRSEAGALGKESKGLYRLHQFSKVEMFVVCESEQSDAIHNELLQQEMEIFSELELHCRVLDMPTEDLGNSAYRKFDIEAWMPSRRAYGEVTSTSNCTDYQSRRLNIRCKQEKGNTFAHTLNGTAIAVPRTILAILENNQQADGSVLIPSVLVPFMGGQSVIRKK